MSQNIQVGGEIISARAAMAIVGMIEHDAKEFAGEFHGQNRSAKFRANWINEYDFVDANWKTFVGAVRAMYAERLSDPKTPPEDARKMHLALLVERAYSEGMRQQGAEADSRLQIGPDTQQFVGDTYENRRIVEKYGTGKNLRAGFLNGVSRARRLVH
jgi:hypothetical protein